MEYSVVTDDNGRAKAENVTGPMGDYVQGAPRNPRMFGDDSGFGGGGGFGSSGSGGFGSSTGGFGDNDGGFGSGPSGDKY